MATTFLSRWQKFHHGTPGRRFRDRYQANKRRRSEYPWIGRLVRTTLAVAAFAVGVVLMVMPGPAVLFFFIAGTLLASDSLTIARWLDLLEVKVRKAWHWGVAHWRKLPLYGKVLLCLVCAITSALCAYVTWKFVL
jgi:hypothetical protein